jgi:hypothetical protein
MPVISIFFGVIIKIHFKDHNPPHFHAEYQGFEAFFDMRTGELLDGKFPNRLRSIIKEWAIEHKDELLKDWDLAQREEPLFKIPGADK